MAMFNTLKYTKVLEGAGIAREQAEAHVQIIAEIVEADLATKSDIRELKKDLKSDIKGLQDEIIKSEYRIIFKLTAILIIAISTTTAIIGAVYKFL
jgi:hypothetical protein